MRGIYDFLNSFWLEIVKTFKILSRNKMGLFGFLLMVLIILISRSSTVVRIS